MNARDYYGNVPIVFGVVSPNVVVVVRLGVPGTWFSVGM